MGDTLRLKVFLAVLILLLASVFVSTAAVAQVNGSSTRQDSFTVSIEGDIEIHPVSGEKSATISKDVQNSYSVKVYNDQPFNVDFKLEIMNVPSDWEAIFADSSATTLTFTVTSKSEKIVNVIVSSSVYTTYNMTIQASATSPPGDTKSDYIILKCESDLITITPDSTKKYIGAGKGGTFKVDVKNNYNEPWDVKLGVSPDFNASDKPLEEYWAFKYDQSSFTIPSLGTVTKNLTIYPPKNAKPNDYHVFQVSGSVEGDTRTFLSVAISCIVKEVYNLSVSINPLEISADPGDILNYTIKVVNHADNPDQVGVQVVGDSDPWPFVFSGAISTLVKEFDIAARQIKYVYLALTVPPNAEAGKHTLALNISGKAGTHKHEIVTNVNESHKVTLSYTDEVIILEQDGNLVYPVTLADNTFRIKLKNDGNTLETAKIKLKDIESGWQVAFIAVESGSSTTNTTPANPAAPIDIKVLGIEYSFTQEATEITLNVQRFFQTYLVLSVKPPAGAPATLHSFAITVEYGPQLVIPNFIVNMTLSISNIEILDLDGDLNNGPDFVVLNPNATKNLKFQITIRNNYPLATTDFDVILYIEFTNEKDRVHVDNLQPGEEKDIILTWRDPEDGYHYVDIKVTGPSIGTNEPNARGQIVVEGEDSDNTIFWIIIFIIALLILLIIAGVIIYMRIRTLGTSEDKEAEEYDKLYGDGKKRKKKDGEEEDSETEEYLHGAKYKSRKSRREMDKDAEKLYGDDEKKGDRKKGGRRRRDRDDEDEPKGKRGGKGRKRPGKPRRGKASKFDDDEDFL